MNKRGAFQLVLGLSIVMLLLVGRLGAQGPGSDPAADSAAAASEAETRGAADPAAPQGRVGAVIVPIEGVIDDYTARILNQRIETARELGAQVMIIQLDTPGGLVQSGLEIARQLKRTTDLHVIVFVRNWAMSAGTMIAIAAHEIVMEPYAQIGDVAPIMMGPGGVQSLGETERAKQEGPVLADFRESARMRGYSVHLAEAMVSMPRVVYWVERVEDGEVVDRRFADRPERNRLIEMETEQWRDVTMDGINVPVVNEVSLLTMTTEEAVLLGFVSEVHDSPEALAEARGYQVLATLSPTFGETVIGFLSSMGVQALLMTVFMFSLYLSFSTPGTGLPEVVAVSALAVLVGVPLMTGYAEWWQIVAVLLGLVLIAVEIFLLPGFGFAGISGVLMVLFGLTMILVPPELPELPRFWPSLPGTWLAIQKALLVVFGSLAVSLLLMMWAAKYLPKSTRFGRLILTATVGGSEGGPVLADIPAPFQEVAWPHTGAVGVAVSDLRPFGSAEFHDDLINDTRSVDVYSDSGFVRRGTKVKVHRVQGSRVVVKAVV